MFKKKKKSTVEEMLNDEANSAFEKDDTFNRKSPGEVIEQLYSKELSLNRFKRNKQNRGKKILAVALLTVCAIAASLVYNYNRFIIYKEYIASRKGQIEAELQRRANLFNNLVSLALDYASLEREIFDHVAEARNTLRDKNTLDSKLVENDSSIPIPGGRGSSSEITDIKQSLSRLMAIVEQYPDLKANQTYKYLMENITEIENRITEKRGNYNESIKTFNNKISVFPWKYLARVFGFKKAEYFESSPGESINPKLLPDSYQKILSERGKKNSGSLEK